MLALVHVIDLRSKALSLRCAQGSLLRRDDVMEMGVMTGPVGAAVPPQASEASRALRAMVERTWPKRLGRFGKREEAPRRPLR
jgi:hypothetical protein